MRIQRYASILFLGRPACLESTCAKALGLRVWQVGALAAFSLIYLVFFPPTQREVDAIGDPIMPWSSRRSLRAIQLDTVSLKLDTSTPLDLIIDNKYTIIFHATRKPQLLRETVEYYDAQECPSLHSIIVSWAHGATSIGKTPVPDFLTDGRYNRYPLQAIVPRSTDRNERFRIPEYLHTNAVLHLDEDVRISCEDLEFAFKLWRTTYSDRIVGFRPQSHIVRDDGTWAVDSSLHGLSRSGYSMVSTSAAFMHRRYMESYFSNHDMPKGVREMVTYRQNCEGFAMNFLVASLTAKPPLYIGQHGSSLRPWIAFRNGLLEMTENACMQDLAELFQGMPLDAARSTLKWKRARVFSTTAAVPKRRSRPATRRKKRNDDAIVQVT
jgi:hypothetical protein